MKKPVILTGIRANEEPTLGNFLGAIVPMVNMQKEYSKDYQINMFVPDLHSFTTPIDHKTLYKKTIHNLKYFIAAGIEIENKNTYLYRQSFVPAHSQLMWILDCFTYVGEMQRMTQFKDKSSEHSASVTMGLMNYPVLMAADILLYNAEYVPVGEDQFQHLEIARDIAERMNNKFGELFVVPKETSKQTHFMKRDKGLRIRSLTNPSKKMSKSSDDEKSKISLSDNPNDAKKKIMRAVTDDKAEINFDWDNQPGVTSLLQIESLISGKSQEDVNSEWVGKTRYGDLKKQVTDTVANFLEDFHKKYNEIDDKKLLEYLERCEEEMNKTANETLLRVQKAVGLRQ